MLKVRVIRRNEKHQRNSEGFEKYRQTILQRINHFVGLRIPTNLSCFDQNTLLTPRLGAHHSNHIQKPLLLQVTSGKYVTNPWPCSPKRALDTRSACSGPALSRSAKQRNTWPTQLSRRIVSRICSSSHNENAVLAAKYGGEELYIPGANVERYGTVGNDFYRRDRRVQSRRNWAGLSG